MNSEQPPRHSVRTSGRAPAQYPDRGAVEDSFATHVNPGKVSAYRALGLEIVMGEREGIRFRDAYDGRWYVNCHCNGGVFNLGHRNPSVVQAVRRALEDLDIGNHHLVSGWRAALAERLAATTGGALPGVVFGVSGGEAVDLAIKVARAHTGRTDVVSAAGGYHGHTGLAMAAGDPEYRRPVRSQSPRLPAGPVRRHRCVGGRRRQRHGRGAPGAHPRNPGYADSRSRLPGGGAGAVRPTRSSVGPRRGADGPRAHRHHVVPPAGGRHSRPAGDRQGPVRWHLSHHRHSDDVGAARLFIEHPFVHISTYGGAELGCVAALSVLDIVETPGFLERVRTLGDLFDAGLDGLPVELRRRGLFMGLRFAEADGGLTATRSMIEHGVFAIFANNDPSVLQFLPPLVMTDDEAGDLIDTVVAALGA
ncbi:MAG: aminotransferase class III-fold pyridoxal phosphate-dependent enzyme [Microthrixaceae bacterium]